MAVKIFNVARSDKNEILTNVFRSKGVLVGTSTMNNDDAENCWPGGRDDRSALP